ncbi:MAG TPA: PocR ligand-binding domain-containing protein [Bacteroidales bacterium]|nr:PocR ligand-binding domain-containing protein [Bacteroidales bacterium]
MDYKLEDIISIPAFQSLQEKLYLISPFPTGIIDNDGNILTAVAWQDLCTKFYRKHPICERECIKSDKYILKNLHKANPSISYKCPHGLIDTATPIIIEGKHLANYFIGQFFLEPPDLDLYRKQARRYGFDEDAFLEAVKKVPIWTNQQLNDRLAFVKEFIDIIALAGLRQLKELQINRELKESEERFKSIVESTDDFIWLVEPAGFGIISFNQALYDYFLNVRKIELKLGDKMQVLSPAKATDWDRFYKKALKKGKYETEYEVVAGDKILYLSFNTIKSGDEVTAISVFGKDITRVKQHERDLITAKERAEKNEIQLKESQAMAKLGSWEFDFTTGIFTFTDNFYKIFNTSVEEIGSYQLPAGEYATRFVHPDDAHLVGIEVEKAIETNDPDYTAYTEHRIIRMDGTEGFIGVRFLIVKNKESETVRSYGVIQDITDRKINEQELIEAKEKAEENNRLKSAFLMNMSHEIRTPMNGILGFMNLMNDPAINEEDRREYITLINKSGDRLLNTINDLIEISKIEIGDINLKSENIDLEELMDFIYNFFKRECDEKGLELSIGGQIKGNEAQIMSDRLKLEGILINLVKNAIKFTVKGSITISNTLEDGKLWFYVSDTGRGIPKDKFDAVFDRFVQVDYGGKRNYEGSGIGLSIVKAYVEALEGSIKIESELGKGSTFIFSIPYIHADTITGTDFKIINGHQSKKTILIAEDEDINFRLLEKLLAEEYRLIRAKTAEEAVTLFNVNPGISLILMDIKMPGAFDGLEATRRIRQAGHRVPVIAQTAYAMNDDKLKAEAAGCNGFLTKPFRQRELNEVISKHLPR